MAAKTQRKPGPRGITSAMKARYIDLISQGRTKGAAAKACGRDSRRFRELEVNDEEFAARVEEAFEVAGRDALVEVATCRAIDGWDEPVFQGGKQVGTVHKHDSTLLMFLIKQRDPSFRENGGKTQVELSGPDGKPIEVRDPDSVDAELNRLVAELAAREAAAARASAS